MIVDYRTYCSIYALCVALHVACFLLINWKGGRHYWRAEAVIWGAAGATLFANYLDWLWS